MAGYEYDIPLTPGISYRDYVQDAWLWTNTPIVDRSKPVVIKTNNQTVTDVSFVNAQNNRLRELFQTEPYLVNPTGNNLLHTYTTLIEITQQISPLYTPVNHAGFRTMDVGCIGLFNVSVETPNPLPSGVKNLSLRLTVTLTDSSAAVYRHEVDISNYVSENNRNSRYALRNVFIPLLDTSGKQRTDITKVQVFIDFKSENFVNSPPQFALSDLKVKFGRLWVGNFMPIGFDSDWSITLDNPSKINYSSGLDAHPIEQRRRRRGSFPISNILKEDAMTSVADIETGKPFATFSDMQLQSGKDYPLVVSHQRERSESTPYVAFPDPYVLFGLMSKDMSIQHVSGPLYQTQIDVVELI